MVSPIASKRMSAEQFLEWEEKQPDKHEFIEGEIYAMVGVTRLHAAVTGNIFSWMLQYLRGTRCRAYVADMKLKLETADAFFLSGCIRHLLRIRSPGRALYDETSNDCRGFV